LVALVEYRRLSLILEDFLMDSIIFDLDGTLWDATETVLEVWNDVIHLKQDIRKPLTIKDLQGSMGLQIKEIGEKFFPYLSPKRQMEIMTECCEVETEILSQKGGKLYQHLEETLQGLSTKYKLFIVSNCQEGYIEAFFNVHGLSKYFLDYENPGRTGLSKGENIKLIIKRNQLANPVYVGDTAGDLKGAEVAGIPFVYASYGFGTVDSYDYKIERFNQLIDLFLPE
jgi:phosphoglycolate phosphatase